MADPTPSAPATASSVTSSTPASKPGPPSAASIDVSLPTVDWKMRRIFCWTIGAALLGLIGLAIVKQQPAFAWPLVAALTLDIMFYVGGATTTEIVQLVQSSGIIKAAQAATGAVQSAADAAAALAGRLGGAPAPAPAPGPAPTPGLGPE